MKDGTKEWPLGDGIYPFRLAIGEIRELQEKCNSICPFTNVVNYSGFPLAIYKRLQSEWSVNDVTETIRLGLIGGGMKPHAATTLVERHVEPNLVNYATLAIAILQEALIGGFDKNAKGESEQAEKKPEAATPSTGSTLQTSIVSPVA